MTDLNTNQYLYKQPYLQNQPTYGDGKGGFPINMDDKRLDPVKETAKSNPAISTAKTLIGEPVNIAIGTVPFLVIDRLLKWLPKGESFEKSGLGKLIGHIDNFTEKLSKFNWIKETYAKLPDTNFIKQIINAKPATPRFSMAKAQVTPSRINILNQMIDEAVEVIKPDTTASKELLKTLKTGTNNPIAIQESLKLAGKNPSERFINLLELSKDPSKEGLWDKVLKFFGQTSEKRLLKEAIRIKEAPPVIVANLKKALENPEAAEKLLKKFGEKAVNKPKVTERFLRRYGNILDVNEFKNAANSVKNGQNIYDIAYKKAQDLIGAGNETKIFKNLSNRAEFFTKDHSGMSKIAMSVYNNMTTFLSAHVGKLTKGVSIKSLGSNAIKLGGVAFMFCMGANLLGEIVKDTWNAPKGEKVSTLAHDTISKLGSWIMMIPLGFFMFKGIGSLKNLTGTGISGVLKAPFRALGTLFSTGLKTKKGGVLKTISNGLKRVGGGTGRFLLFMLALTPLTDKILRFVSHSIFGKPNALLAKEKAEAESGKTENAATSNNTDDLKKALEQNKAGMITVAAKNQQNTFGSINPMIEKHLKAKEAASVVKPAPVQEIPAKQQYIPSDTSKIQQENIEKKAKFDATLAKTDSIIKNAETALGS